MAEKAVLLGINGYKSVSPLRGCLNDVENVRRLLTGTFEFPGDRIKSLVDGEVTKTKVRQHMKWLFEDLQPGDRAVFHFSGHGSYTADEDGDDDGGRDELLCLYDMDFARNTTYFLDDELRKWLKTLPQGVQMVVFLDNCHSGTGTRKIVPRGLEADVSRLPLIDLETTARMAATDRSIRGVRSSGSEASVVRALLPDRDDDDMVPNEAVLARFIEPPREIQRRAGRPGQTRAAVAVEGMNHVLLAACRDDQTAADAWIDGKHQGAFTHHLCKLLRSGGAQWDLHEIESRLSAALRDGQFNQIPQVEAASLTGPLFGNGTTAAAQPPRPADPPSTTVPPVSSETSPPVEVNASGPPHAVVSGMPPECDPVVPAPVEAANSMAMTGEAPRLIEEFLAAYNRLLTVMGGHPGLAAGLGHAPGMGQTPGARDLRRHLVCVHGICDHRAGFSDPWWNSLAPYAPSLNGGVRDVSRHEVVWSDLVRKSTRDVNLSPEHQEAYREIVDTLEDRAQRQTVDTAPVARDLDAMDRSLEMQRAMFGVPGLECANDFITYLLNRSIRDEVIDRFRQKVGPLLRSGARVDVISHSWGTVVAYEALCQMEREQLPNNAVLNFFTVGSALSISPVKWRLLENAADGHRPRLVRRWINLDAKNDVVGGPMRGRPYAVDLEFVGLEPVGCQLFPPDPACAHSSYFVTANVLVNRHIFGRFIEEG